MGGKRKRDLLVQARESTSVPGTVLPDPFIMIRVISDREYADILGVSLDTVRRMDARGEGPPKIKLSTRRHGRRISDIAALLDALARSGQGRKAE